MFYSEAECITTYMSEQCHMATLSLWKGKYFKMDIWPLHPKLGSY